MSGVPARVTYIGIGVRDLPVMRAFYERLGWDAGEGSSDGFVWFECGGTRVSLYPWHLLAAEAGVPADGPHTAFRGITLAVNCETEGRAREVLEAARAAGARITAEGVMHPHDVWSGYFADPEGNLWEVAWSPRSNRFDARGVLIDR